MLVLIDNTETNLVACWPTNQLQHTDTVSLSQNLESTKYAVQGKVLGIDSKLSTIPDRSK